MVHVAFFLPNMGKTSRDDSWSMYKQTADFSLSCESPKEIVFPSGDKDKSILISDGMRMLCINPGDRLLKEVGEQKI